MTLYKAKISFKTGTCINRLATISVVGQRGRVRGARVFYTFTKNWKKVRAI